MTELHPGNSIIGKAYNPIEVQMHDLSLGTSAQAEQLGEMTQMSGST